MRAGIAEAEAEPPGDVSLLFEHAFADPPPSFAEELAELQRVLGDTEDAPPSQGQDQQV